MPNSSPIGASHDRPAPDASRRRFCVVTRHRRREVFVKFISMLIAAIALAFAATSPVQARQPDKAVLLLNSISIASTRRSPRPRTRVFRQGRHRSRNPGGTRFRTNGAGDRRRYRNVRLRGLRHDREGGRPGSADRHRRVLLQKIPMAVIGLAEAQRAQARRHPRQDGRAHSGRFAFADLATVPAQDRPGPTPTSTLSAAISRPSSTRSLTDKPISCSGT